MKRRTLLLLTLIVMILPVLLACDGGEEMQKPSVILSRSNLELSVGDVYTLDASVYPAELSSAKISWTTSNPDVVTCSDGKLRAVALGTAVVKARAEGGNYAAVTVSVTESVRAYRNIPLGQSYDIPEDLYSSLFSEEEEITFSTSDPSVATCEGGKITAHGIGVTDVFVNSDGKSLLLIRITTYILETDLVSFSEPELPVVLSYSKGGVSTAVRIDGFEVEIFDDEKFGKDAVGVRFSVKYTKESDTGGTEPKNPVKFRIELYSGEVGYCTSYTVTAEDIAVGEVGEYVAKEFAADISKGARTFSIKLVEAE